MNYSHLISFRIIQILILFTNFFPPLYSQNENVSDNFANRFSAIGSTSYHFSPWTQYNHAFERFDEALRFSPYFIQPHGTIETIKGDVTFELALSYQVSEDIRLRAAVSHIRTGATTNVNYATAQFGDYVLHRLDVDVRLHVNTIGIGADYTIQLGGAFRLQLYTIGQLAFGAFSFDHKYSGFANYADYVFLHTAELTQTVLGSNSGASFVYQLTNTLSLSLSAEYRYFVFNYFQGSATASRTYGSETEKRNYATTLLYQRGYFGITAENGYSIDYPWQSVSSYDEVKGGIVDLRSFGLKLEIEIGL